MNHYKSATEQRTRAARLRALTMLLVGALSMVSAGETLAQQRATKDATAKKDDPKKLSERLLRKTATGADEDVMDALIRLMDRSARHLDVSFDAGRETQDVQRQIMERLDEAIRVAAAQRRPTRSKSQKASGDKRKKSRGKKPTKKSATAEQSKKTGSSDSKEGSQVGTPTEGTASGTELDNRRRAWGHLPMRQRDEIIQGLRDRYLERYRVWIERYYKALQENKD